jgi:hypothetical protein
MANILKEFCEDVMEELLIRACDRCGEITEVDDDFIYDECHKIHQVFSEGKSYTCGCCGVKMNPPKIKDLSQDYINNLEQSYDNKRS